MSVTQIRFRPQCHSEFTLHGVASGSFPEENTHTHTWTYLRVWQREYLLTLPPPTVQTVWVSRTVLRIQIHLFEKEVAMLVREVAKQTPLSARFLAQGRKSADLCKDSRMNLWALVNAVVPYWCSVEPRVPRSENMGSAIKISRKYVVY
jgi:hypothetical protein